MLLFDDAVPAAGLSEAPTESSLGTHAYSVSSHLVYGVPWRRCETSSGQFSFIALAWLGREVRLYRRGTQHKSISRTPVYVINRSLSQPNFG